MLQKKETALHYSARSGNAGVLREMLSLMKPNDIQTAVNKQSSDGWSPLMAAAHGGHLPVVQTLLDNHARVDVFDLEGRAALHLTAEKGQREICDLLLSHKAFVNSKVMSGQTALHMAATNGFNDLVKVLVVKHNAMIEALTLVREYPSLLFCLKQMNNTQIITNNENQQ
jgi:ankyrin repeat protein